MEGPHQGLEHLSLPVWGRTSGVSCSRLTLILVCRAVQQQCMEITCTYVVSAAGLSGLGSALKLQ